MAKKKIENKNRKNSSKKHPGATTRKGSNDKAGHKGSNDKATHHNLDVFKPAYFHLAVGIVLSVLCCYALKAFAKGEVNAGAVAGNMMKDVQVINTTSVHRLEQTNSSSLHNERIDETCKFYLAKSTIENSGNGIYTTEPIAAGQKIGLEDLVIQLPDITPQYAASMRLLLFNYAWDGSKFGGQYEGQRVYSLVPGVGALANGHQTMFNTDVGGPGPVMDHAGLTRHQSPGAGAVTHYHKYSFVAMDDIVAGGEILMNYGVNWFKERERKGIMKSPDTLQEKARSTDWLRENGICLDHIKVGPSTKEHAGRGAFSQRRFQKGALVVATPILQILDRRAMVMKRMKGGVEEVTEQLILNYCYGHRDSSLLFFPYVSIRRKPKQMYVSQSMSLKVFHFFHVFSLQAPFVNFINHDFQYPNVELRWSRSSQHSIQIQNMSLADLKQLQNTGLVLDLVALRDIEEGEELFLNYGEAWDEAWDAHVRDWYDEETSAERQVSYAHDLDEKYECFKQMFNGINAKYLAKLGSAMAGAFQY